MPKIVCRHCGRELYTVAPLESLFADERRCPRCGTAMNLERRDAERRKSERREDAAEPTPSDAEPTPPAATERRAADRRATSRRKKDRGPFYREPGAG